MSRSSSSATVYLTRTPLRAEEVRALYTNHASQRLQSDSWPWEMSLRSEVVAFRDVQLNVEWLQPGEVAKVSAAGVVKVVKLLSLDRWAEARINDELRERNVPGHLTGKWIYFFRKWTSDLSELSDANLDILLIMEDGGESFRRMSSTTYPGPFPHLRHVVKALDTILDGMSRLEPTTADLFAGGARFYHGDIQPKNLVYNLTSGEIRLIDYGLAYLELLDGVITPRRHSTNVKPANGTHSVESLMRVIFNLQTKFVYDSEEQRVTWSSWIARIKKHPFQAGVCRQQLRSAFSELLHS